MKRGGFMPKRDGHIYCINHTDERMIKNEGFNALTTVQYEEGHIKFVPSTGIPTVVFYCNLCGYIEVYAAQKTAYWEKSVMADMRDRAGIE
jgi:hypothetical protein